MSTCTSTFAYQFILIMTHGTAIPNLHKKRKNKIQSSGDLEYTGVICIYARGFLIIHKRNNINLGVGSDEECIVYLYV